MRNDEAPAVEIVITGFRLSKLTPNVLGDLNGSGEVDGADLGMLLGGGACPRPT